MIDVQDVCLVDAHAERNGGHDDIAARGHPPLLGGDAILRAHAGVVRAGGESRGREERRDAERRALERDVDDCGAGRPLAKPIDQRLVTLRRTGRGGQERQVGAIEPGDHGVCVSDSEPGTDVSDDGGRRRSGQCEDSLGPEFTRSSGELEVVRPEVVAPLRDAVRLVDGTSIGNVFGNSRRENDGLLQNKGDLGPELFDPQLAQIHSFHQNRTGGGIKETRKHV